MRLRARRQGNQAPERRRVVIRRLRIEDLRRARIARRAHRCCPVRSRSPATSRRPTSASTARSSSAIRTSFGCCNLLVRRSYRRAGCHPRTGAPSARWPGSRPPERGSSRRTPVLRRALLRPPASGGAACGRTSFRCRGRWPRVRRAPGSAARTGRRPDRARGRAAARVMDTAAVDEKAVGRPLHSHRRVGPEIDLPDSEDRQEGEGRLERDLHRIALECAAGRERRSRRRLIASARWPAPAAAGSSAGSGYTGCTTVASSPTACSSRPPSARPGSRCAACRASSSERCRTG